MRWLEEEFFKGFIKVLRNVCNVFDCMLFIDAFGYFQYFAVTQMVRILPTALSSLNNSKLDRISKAPLWS